MARGTSPPKTPLDIFLFRLSLRLPLGALGLVERIEAAFGGMQSVRWQEGNQLLSPARLLLPSYSVLEGLVWGDQKAGSTSSLIESLKGRVQEGGVELVSEEDADADDDSFQRVS